MIKGRLLASVCALGLMAAAPALAAGMDNNATSPGMNGTSMSNGGGNWQHGASNANGDMARSQSAMDKSDHGAMTGSSANTMRDQNADNDRGGNGMDRSRSAMSREHADRGRQSMRRGRGESDTSQNGDVDRLNEQSLQAARQGHPFMTGSNGVDQDQGMRGDQGMRSDQGMQSGQGMRSDQGMREDQGGQPGHTKM